MNNLFVPSVFYCKTHYRHYFNVKVVIFIFYYLFVKITFYVVAEHSKCQSIHFWSSIKSVSEWVGLKQIVIP